MSTHTSETVHTVKETAPLPTTPQDTEEVSVRKRVSTSAFLSTFLIELVFNIVLVVLVFSAGVATHAAGHLTITSAQVGTTIAFLFGGGGLALLAIGAIAIVVLGLWLSNRLFQKGHSLMAIIAIFVLALITIEVFSRVTNWSFLAGVLPFLLLLAVTAIETLVTASSVPAATIRTTRLRKGVTNH